MSDNKLKEDLVKVYKEWKDLEKKADQRRQRDPETGASGGWGQDPDKVGALS